MSVLAFTAVIALKFLEIGYLRLIRVGYQPKFKKISVSASGRYTDFFVYLRIGKTKLIRPYLTIVLRLDHHAQIPPLASYPARSSSNMTEIRLWFLFPQKLYI